jgi:monofunctional biosynthetic peptidoglycan transglycosylase
MRRFLSIAWYGSFAVGCTLCLWCLLLTWLPVPVTPYQLWRLLEQAAGDGDIRLSKSWMSYDEVNKNIFRAVIGAEDGRFLSHSGIDFKAVRDAQKRNQARKGKKLFGASTISMQTAKNTFLLHQRNYIRKGLEAIFTTMIEFFWGKKRILEVYVNVIEWGNGIYGVEAASQEFFGVSASQLSAQQASLLAAVLPGPRIWSPAKPTAYIQRRSAWIRGRMGVAIPK